MTFSNLWICGLEKTLALFSVQPYHIPPRSELSASIPHKAKFVQVPTTSYWPIQSSPYYDSHGVVCGSWPDSHGKVSNWIYSLCQFEDLFLAPQLKLPPHPIGQLRNLRTTIYMRMCAVPDLTCMGRFQIGSIAFTNSNIYFWHLCSSSHFHVNLNFHNITIPLSRLHIPVRKPISVLPLLPFDLVFPHQMLCRKLDSLPCLLLAAACFGSYLELISSH